MTQMHKYWIYPKDRYGGSIESPGSRNRFEIRPAWEHTPPASERYAHLNLLVHGNAQYPIELLLEHVCLQPTDISCRVKLDDTGNTNAFCLSPPLGELQKDLVATQRELRAKENSRTEMVVNLLCRLQSFVVRSPQDAAPRAEFVFEVCDYAQYMATNYSVDLCFADGGSLRDILEPIDEETGLPPALEVSPCANQLGVNAVVLSADHFIFVMERSDKEYTFAGQDGPPISGTQMYAYKDERKLKPQQGHTITVLPGPAKSYFDEDGAPNPFMGVLAQGHEEIGLTADCIAADGTKMIGLNRDWTRGGLPDCFFVIHANRSLRALVTHMRPHAARDSWEWSDYRKYRLMDIRTGLLSLAKTDEVVDELLEKGVTPALVTNLYLFRQYVASIVDPKTGLWEDGPKAGL